jgi:hypothetical protein
MDLEESLPTIVCHAWVLHPPRPALQSKIPQAPIVYPTAPDRKLR